MFDLKKSALLIISLFTYPCFAFDSFEHLWMGDLIELKFPEELKDQINHNYAYSEFLDPIKNLFSVNKPYPQYLDIRGLRISFGEITAIAGDYFTLPDTTISDLEDNKLSIEDADQQRAYRFRRAFSTFIADFPNDAEKMRADCVPDAEHEKYALHHFWPYFSDRQEICKPYENPFKPKVYLQKLRSIIVSEFKTLLNFDPDITKEAGLLEDTCMIEKKCEQKMRPAQKLIEKINEDKSYFSDIQDVHTVLVAKKTLYALINETFFAELPPYYTNILSKNFDHFGEQAKQTYQTGHREALKVAKQANEESDLKKKYELLNMAYAMEAFASHFLTDLFSAGHIRTPRYAIFKNSYWGKSAGLAANAMHDEDGYYGLKVKNERKSSWKAYGDYSYFSDRSVINRQIIDLALQSSVDEVWDVYETGNLPHHFKAMEFVPKLAEDNFTPLFSEADDDINVRSSFDNIHEKIMSKPSLISWLYSWTYTPHWKKSIYDFRSVLNQLDASHKTLIKFDCKLHQIAANEQGSILDTTLAEANMIKLSDYQFESEDFKIMDKEYIISSDAVYIKALDTCKQVREKTKQEIDIIAEDPLITPKKIEEVILYNQDGYLHSHPKVYTIQ